MISKYEIAKQFSAGLVAALRPTAFRKMASKHWQAGYGAGYAMRAEKNLRLSDYLVSIGSKPMEIVTTQGIQESTDTVQ